MSGLGMRANAFWARAGRRKCSWPATNKRARTKVRFQSACHYQGSGGFAHPSIVKILIALAGWCAVKVIKRAPKSREYPVDFEREVKILRHLQHPNIMALHEAFETPHELVIAAEYLSGGQMFGRVALLENYSEEVESAWRSAALFSQTLVLTCISM